MTHPEAQARPLFVAYVPGLDRRRLSAQNSPFVHGLFGQFPSVRLRTQPTTELFPTLITGVNPDEHGIWQVSLRETGRDRWIDRWLDASPDWLTTTVQLVGHAWNPAYDLPAIPRRRRRRLEQHRFKYTRRTRSDDIVRIIGGVPSLFGLLGARSRYRIFTDFRRVADLIDEPRETRYLLDMVEFYAFDLLSHWNLDRTGVMDRHLRIVDRLLAAWAERSHRAGIRMVLLVDHGQEQVRRTIDLREVLRGSGTSREECLEYVEVGVARYWFRHARAREAVERELRKVPGIHVKRPEELRAYDLHFPDGRFGELYAIAEPGTIFFPHDFYHPLANLYMGITKPSLHRRIVHPVHRGAHGQLPDHPAEEGYVVVLDASYEVTQERVPLVDVAPTLLALLRHPPAPTMRGSSFLRPRPRDAA